MLMRCFISIFILLAIFFTDLYSVEIGAHINYLETQGYKDGTSSNSKSDSGYIAGPYVHFRFNLPSIGKIKVGPYLEFGQLTAKNLAIGEKVSEKKIIQAGGQLEVEIVKIGQTTVFTRLGMGHATHTYRGSYLDPNKFIHISCFINSNFCFFIHRQKICYTQMARSSSSWFLYGLCYLFSSFRNFSYLKAT